MATTTSFEAACILQVPTFDFCVNGPFLLAITVLLISSVFGTVCWWCGRNPRWRAKGEFWFLDLTTERMTSEVIGFFGVFLMFSIALQMWLGYSALQGVPRYPPLSSITTSPFGHTVVTTSGEPFVKPIALLLATAEGESPLTNQFMCIAQVEQNSTCVVALRNNFVLTKLEGVAVFDSLVLTLPDGCASKWITIKTRCYQASSSEKKRQSPDAASPNPSLLGPEFAVLVTPLMLLSNVTSLNVTQHPPPLLAFTAGESNISVSVPVSVKLHCTRSCANKVVSAVVINFCSAESPTLDDIARSLAWNESVSEIVSEFVAKVSENGGACAVVTLSAIINQLIALLQGELGTVLSQGWPALIGLLYNMFASGGFGGIIPLLTPETRRSSSSFQQPNSVAPTTAPPSPSYVDEIEQTVQLVIDNWPLVRKLMSITNVTWRNIINTNLTAVSELLPSVLASDPAFLHYFTTYVSSLSDPTLFWESSTSAQTESLSALTDENGVAKFDFALSASESGLKYMLFTVDDMSFAQNFESSKPFYVYNNIAGVLLAPVILGNMVVASWALTQGDLVPGAFFDCPFIGHQNEANVWCSETTDNDLVLDVTGQVQYYVGVAFETVGDDNETVRFAPWGVGSIHDRTEYVNFTHEQTQGNCHCKIQMLPADGGGTLRPRVHINSWAVRGNTTFYDNVSTWYGISFGVTGGNEGLYDLRLICNGVKSNPIRVTILSTLTPSSPIDKTTFWIFLILAMVACQPIFWANAALPISFDGSTTKLIARLRAGQSRALLGVLGMTGLMALLALIKAYPSSSFQFTGMIMEVPFSVDYFAMTVRTLAHTALSDDFSSGNPQLWNVLLQYVSMLTVLVLFLMFGWHFYKFGMASSRVQYYDMLRRLHITPNTAPLHHVRPFRGFLKYIVALTFFKLCILGFTLPALIVASNARQFSGQQHCVVDFATVVASFMLPSAAALGFLFRSLRENVLFTNKPLASKLGRWVFTHSLPLIALYQIMSSNPSCYVSELNVLINFALAAALMMADEDENVIFVRISPPVTVGGEGWSGTENNGAFLKLPPWIFTWTAPLCAISQIASQITLSNGDVAATASVLFVLLATLQFRLTALMSSLTPMESEQVGKFQFPRGGNFIARAAQLYGDHSRRFLHGSVRMQALVLVMVWVLTVVSAVVPAIGWTLVSITLLWVIPVLVALRTQVGRASAGWFRSLQSSAFETLCDIVFGFMTCDPKIVCYVIAITGGIVGVFFGLPISWVALTFTTYLFWRSLGSEAFDTRKQDEYLNQQPSHPSRTTRNRGSLLKPSLSPRTALADDLAYKSLAEDLKDSHPRTLPWPETQLSLVQPASFQERTPDDIDLETNTTTSVPTTTLTSTTIPTTTSTSITASASPAVTSATMASNTTTSVLGTASSFISASLSTTPTTTTTSNNNITQTAKDPPWDGDSSSVSSLPSLSFKDRKDSNLLHSATSTAPNSPLTTTWRGGYLQPSNSNFLLPRHSRTFSSDSSMSNNPNFDMHSTHSTIYPHPPSELQAFTPWEGEHPEVRIARHRLYVQRLFGEAPYEHLSCNQSLSNRFRCYRHMCACCNKMCCRCCNSCNYNKSNKITPIEETGLHESLLGEEADNESMLKESTVVHPKRIPIKKLLEFRASSFGLADYPLRLKLGVGLSLWIAFLLSICCLVQVQWLQYGYYTVWAIQGRMEAKSANHFLAFDDSTDMVFPVAFLSVPGLLFRLAGFVLLRLAENPNLDPNVYIFIAFWALFGSAVVGFLTVLLFAVLLCNTYKRQLLKMRRGVYPFDRSRIADFRPTYASRFIGYQIVHSTCAWLTVFVIMVLIGIVVLLVYYWPAFREALWNLVKGLALQGVQVIVLVSAFRLGTDVLFTANRGKAEKLGGGPRTVVRLDNKFLRAWTYVDYYNIFIYLVTGTYIVIVRLLFMPLLLIARLARLDVSVFPRKTESWDTAYSSYIAMLVTDHTYNNPVCVVFVHLLGQDLLQKVRQEEEVAREKWMQQMSDTESPAVSLTDESALKRAFRARLGGDAFRASPAYLEWKLERLKRVRARNRWHLFIFLHHNVALRAFRKHYLKKSEQADSIECKHSP